jgi:hypothetical protein
VEDRWKLVHDHRRLVVSVDMGTPFTATETETLSVAVSSELSEEDITEVVLIGPRPVEEAAFKDFYGVAKAVGMIANDAGKAFRIAH